MKIAISGIGGLGGYFGGLLAHYYENSPETEIYFIARGENEKMIRQHGLRVISSKGNFSAFPKQTTSDPAELGIVDLFICCTKRYDLEANLNQCKSCINDNTIILPLLNGVDSREPILKLFPKNEVLEGCVYLVARLTEPGVIMETGNIAKLFFGAIDAKNERLKKVLDIFLAAGIDATLSENITQVIWEKFLFISPVATLTSFLDCSISDILSDPAKKDLFGQLLSEIIALAKMKGIAVQETLYQLTIDRMSALPAGSTSSMHSDFRKGKSTELNSLTGYIVKEAALLNIQVPTYERMYHSLNTRN